MLFRIVIECIFVIAVIGGAFLMGFFFGAFYTVPAGHRGVVLTFGKPAAHPAGEGL